jgi:hypothetical protein
MKSVRAMIHLTLPRRNYFAPRRGLITFLFLIGNSLVVVGPAASAGVSVAGNVEPIAPPASVVLGALESNSFVRLFTERTAVLLNQNVSVDITQPGIVGNTTELTPGIIAANQLVDSYLLHADPVSFGSPSVTYQGSVTFDRPILGLLVQASRLTPTDGVLGSLSTIYTPTVNRGFEWPSSAPGVGDMVQLLPDFRTITFVLKSTSQYDQIRVITASVPEPSSLAMAACCLASACMPWLRRVR